MKAPATPFERLCWSVFDSESVPDGMHVEVIPELTIEQKAEFEQMLLTSLGSTNDTRPFFMAGLMKLTAAAPIIKRRLTEGFKEPGVPVRNVQYLRIDAAHALHRIENWPEALTVILDVIQNAPRVPHYDLLRSHAVRALADFRHHGMAASALFAIVEDQDDFVGSGAILSLKSIYEENPKITSLLDRLHLTQVTPRRWLPETLEERKRLFAELHKITGLSVPEVAMQKKSNSDNESTSPRGEQLPLFPEAN